MVAESGNANAAENVSGIGSRRLQSSCGKGHQLRSGQVFTAGCTCLTGGAGAITLRCRRYVRRREAADPAYEDAVTN